jgi:sec-independent protein translocase protein TatC
MTLFEHLEELRGRIVKMSFGFALGFAIAWWQKEEILGRLARPLLEVWPQATLHFDAPASLFVAYARLSALAGFVVALPILLWQLWAFVAPGLYAREKRFAAPFVVSSTGLFVSGSYFAYRLPIPLAFKFLIGLADPLGKRGMPLRPTIMVGEYLDFVLRMLVAFGLCAELPILVFFLSIAGLVNHRHLIKFFRYFLVIDVIVAAIVTPPDALSQILLALPLAALYGLSIGVAWLFAPEPAREPASLAE